MTIRPPLNNEDWKQAVLLHPFFTGMEKGTALSLIKKGHPSEILQGETFLKSGEKRKGLYLVIEGKAEVYVERESGRQEVLEMISRGEVVGLSCISQLFSAEEDVSIVNVKTVQDSLLFHLEFIDLQPYFPQVKDYLLYETAHRLQDVYQSLSHQLKIGERFTESVTVFERMGEFIQRPPVFTEADRTISEASQRMKIEKVGSLVVMDGKKLAGLITERDLVHRVLAEDIESNTSVSAIMSPNPQTISADDYYYEGLAKLLASENKYLPVLDGGKVVGVLTLKDCMRRSNEGALLSFSAIEDNTYPLEELSGLSQNLAAFLWKSNTPVLRSLEMMTGIHDRVYRRALKQAEQETEGNTLGGYCFYVMGSAGRREQYFMSDQDHFLVYEKKEDEGYYSAFAQKVTGYLERAGFKRCDGNMMSSNEQWRGDLTQWEERVRRWTVHSDEETLLASQNFFAHRLLAGDSSLHNLFERMVAEQLRKGKIFLYRLSQSEKRVPELNSSIRSILGLSKKEVDIKKEILFPFHHSLQILHLANGGKSGSTVEKLAFLQERNVFSKDFHEELLLSLHDLFKLIINYRLKHNETSSIFYLQSLSTLQKEKLYFSVKIVKEFQKMMVSHFTI